MRGQHVRGLAGDAYLVLAAEFKSGGFFRDFSEEIEAFVFLETVVLDSMDEFVDLGGDGTHGGRENGVELAKVCIMPRKVEGDGIECVGVFLEKRERVGGVEGDWVRSHVR